MPVDWTQEGQSEFKVVQALNYAYNETALDTPCSLWQVESADSGIKFDNSLEKNVPIAQNSWYRHLLVIFSQATVYYNATVNKAVPEHVFQVPKYCK